MFKIHRYPTDYPGLAGKDLKPIGPIEQPASHCGKTGFHDQAPEGRRLEGRGGAVNAAAGIGDHRATIGRRRR